MSVCQGCTGDEREMAKQIASVSPRLVSLLLSVLVICAFLRIFMTKQTTLLLDIVCFTFVNKSRAVAGKPREAV